MEVKFVAVQNFMCKVKYLFEKLIRIAKCLKLYLQACRGNTHVVFIAVTVLTLQDIPEYSRVQYICILIHPARYKHCNYTDVNSRNKQIYRHF
jgi:hypothetical protein